MKIFFSFFSLSLFLFACEPNQQSGGGNQSEETGENLEAGTVAEYEGNTNAAIIHTVAFKLKHEPGSSEAREFLEDGRRLLSSIPSVQQFEVRRETSSKNNFEYGFSMKFADQAAYDAYNVHPVHVDFVENRWKKEVVDFMELDYIVID